MAGRLTQAYPAPVGRAQKQKRPDGGRGVAFYRG